MTEVALGRREGGAEDSLARILDFQLQTLELVAQEVRVVAGGWLITQPSLPLVWSVNQVRVTAPIGYEDAVALAEEHMGELPYRQLVLQHQASGRRLEPLFRADGWQVDRELIMAHVREPDREVDTGAVIEPGEHEALALMRRWVGEDPELNLSGEGLRQVVSFSRRAWRARRARRLGVLGPDGGLAAITVLFSDGRTAQVEDVYTVPEQRNRGLGRAAVTRAVALALEGGHEPTFIVADDNDWPKHLYRRIGFEPVGRTWLFHRELVR